MPKSGRLLWLVQGRELKSINVRFQMVPGQISRARFTRNITLKKTDKLTVMENLGANSREV